MKFTLLGLTQNILSSLSSDEVNSITDTTEALQVAEIIKTTYLNMMTRGDFPEQLKLFQLDASTDATLPVLMYRPSNVNTMDWIKYYNVRADNGSSTVYVHDLDLDLASNPPSVPAPPSFQGIRIVSTIEFIDLINQLNRLDTNVSQYNFTEGGHSFRLSYRHDKQPEFCTVLENYYILFDSFDSSVDSTLQSSKTLCYGQIIPEFDMVDTFIPRLDDYQFPLLLNEAKSLAYFELKQTVHPKAEQETKRQWSAVQKNKSLVDKPSYFEQLPNFGRRGSGRGYVL